jgi:hypothetical protein
MILITLSITGVDGVHLAKVLKGIDQGDRPPARWNVFRFVDNMEGSKFRLTEKNKSLFS